MKFEDFRIGGEFRCGDNTWLCTDKGTRVIAAICVSSVAVYDTKTGDQILSREQAKAEGWFNGPPYTVLERVFDENDQEGCTTE